MYSRSPRFSAGVSSSHSARGEGCNESPGPATYSPQKSSPPQSRDSESSASCKPVKRRHFFRLAHAKESVHGGRQEPPLPPHVGPHCDEDNAENEEWNSGCSVQDCSVSLEERVKGFGSCVNKESYFEERARMHAVPAPNAYELCLKRLGAISFGASRTRRFQSAATCVPGPANYRVARRIGRNNSAPPGLAEAFLNRNLKQASLVNSRTKSPPSIPYRNQTMGYVTGRDGTLHLRKNPMRKFRYTKMPVHEDLIAPNKGTSFAHSAGHGRLFAPSDTPSPGSYAPLKQIESTKKCPSGETQNNNDSARFGTLLYRDAMRRAIPGPGSYDNYSYYRKFKGFNMGLMTSRLCDASNPFSASNCEPHPGPGSYDIGRKPNVRWSSIVRRKIDEEEHSFEAQPSFMSSEKRFYQKAEEKKAPGPGQYSVERKLDASSVRYAPSSPRMTDFGHVEATPGPAAYDTAGNIAARSQGSPSSQTAEKKNCFKSRKNIIVHIFSKKPLPPAPFTSRADRFELPVGAGAPGPSAYDAAAASRAKDSFGKIGSRCEKIKKQNRLLSHNSRTPSSSAASDDPRVTLVPRSGGEFLKLPVTPGPADYDLNDAPIHSRGPYAVVGGAPRLLEHENKNPAPNVYNARAELLRKTYNRTLGAQITNPYKTL